MKKQILEIRDNRDGQVIGILELDVSKVYGVYGFGSLPLDAPENLIVLSDSPFSAEATCSPVLGAEYYQWYLDGVPLPTTTTEPNLILTNLTPFTQYRVNVAAGRLGVIGALSNDYSFTTSATAPPIWTTVPTQSGVVGEAFSTTLTDYVTDVDTTGTSLSFSVVSGTLPSGLSIVGSGIQGVPSGIYSGSVTIRVSDGTNTADTSVSFSVLLPDTTAPAIPSNFTATPHSATQVRLAWTVPSDQVVANSVTSGFRAVQIYKDGVRIASVLETDSPNDSYLATTGASALWKVRSIDQKLNASGFTAELSAGPLVNTPDPPAQVAAVRSSAANAQVTWQAPATGVAPTSYRVFKALSAAGPFTQVQQSLAFSYSDTSLQSSETPYYYVVALNGAVESAASPTVSAPLGTVTTLHEDDFSDILMRSNYDGSDGSFGPLVPQNASNYVGAVNPRWNISSVGDLCYNRDALMYTSPLHVRSPGILRTGSLTETIARSARCQLTLDRASDNNGKIERNEIVGMPYSGSGGHNDLSMMRGTEYWLGLSLYLPDAADGADEWIRSNIYIILLQLKVSQFAGAGAIPVTGNPILTLGPDGGYSTGQNINATQWSLVVKGYTGTTVGGGVWRQHNLLFGNVESSKGQWQDFVFRFIPEYRDTWVENGVTQYATTEFWHNDVKLVERIGFSNTVYNATGQAYALKQGIYCGWANPNYGVVQPPPVGPATRYVHHRAEFKLVKYSGAASVPGVAATTAHPGYQAVKPRGSRTAGF